MTLLNILAPYLAGAIAGLFVFATSKRQAARRTLPLPPGPRPLPIIGNLLDIPERKEWLTYQEWSNRYGDVVYAEALGQKIIILGSATAVNDLMERRSAVYSDRPHFLMLMELMGLKWLLSMMPYGETWRRGRKLLHAHVHPGASPRYHSLQLRAARRFARDVLNAKQDKEALPDLLRTNFGQTIVKMVYGIDAKDSESEYISLPVKVIENLSEGGLPGHFLVDLIPILKYIPSWFPGAGFQRYAEEAQNTHRRMRDNPIAIVQAGIADGSAPPSIARTMLEDDAALPPEQSELNLIKDVTGIAYIGGADTTASSVTTYFLAMLVYPNVQLTAQAEVDRVVGKNRLPELDDAPQMPYVQGVVNECLRWLPVVPMSAAHATTRDDEYKGYFIPKGAIVLGALWGILHNPEDYPDPETFNPARYLTHDGLLDPSVRDPRTACFGFGRRICPGRHIADASLFMMVSTLLATVDVVRAKDASGKEIIPQVEMTSGLISHPEPFPWSVRPRSARAKEMLEASLASL